MNVTLVTTSPSGESIAKDHILQIMAVDGGYLSDCSGDLCDREVLVEEQFRFNESGIWSFVVKNRMDIAYVPNVMEVGLIIDKYPEEAESN